MTEVVIEGVRQLMGWSIEEGTWSSYESTLRTTLDRYGFDRTQWGFLAFLSQGPYHDRSPEVIKKARSALGFWYDINGWTWSEELEQLIQRCVTGYAARFQELREDDPRCTGTMTSEMMDQLVEYMSSSNAVGWIQDGIVFQWAFGLRGHQVAEATFGGLNKVDGAWALTMAKDKVKTSEKAKTKAGEVVYHKIIAPPIAKRTVDRLVAAWRARGGGLDVPIIEKYPLAYVGSWIKAAAEEYQWNDDFIMFRGSHCLRHGAAGEARRTLEQQYGAGAGAAGSGLRPVVGRGVAQVTTHGSLGGVYWYMPTNDERRDRMRIGATRTLTPAVLPNLRPPVSTTDRQEAARAQDALSAEAEREREALRQTIALVDEILLLQRLCAEAEQRRAAAHAMSQAEAELRATIALVDDIAAMQQLAAAIEASEEKAGQRRQRDEREDEM